MKKQLSLMTRSLLLSGVAAIMLSSCIFMPPKEETKVSPDTKKEEPDSTDNETQTPADGTGSGTTSPADGQDTQNKDNGTSSDGTENNISTKHGLSLVWQDEFDYSGVPDKTKWKYQTGKSGWGNAEQQNYVSNTTNAETAIVGDGYLKIKAYHNGTEWRSARLNSKQAWKYGYIEAKLKITDRPGAWPAFWMMPEGRSDWPRCGEIDIMENAPAIGNHKVFSTLHAEGHSAGDGKGIGNKTYDKNLSKEWHTFGIKWTGDKITAYYDDVAMGSYSSDGTEVNWPYDQKFYIILNLAIGGTLGGDAYVNNLKGEAEFLVDYVRVYQ